MDALKPTDDSTAVELFARIKRDVSQEEGSGGAAEGVGGALSVVGLASWLRAHVPDSYGLRELEPCVLADQLLCELAIVEKRMGGVDVEQGCAEEGGKSLQERRRR